jgi:hypothetical protein
VNRAVQLVESATILAGQLRTPMCYVCDKPRAVIEYVKTPEQKAAQAARVDASIEDYYNECRARGAFVGD